MLRKSNSKFVRKNKQSGEMKISLVGKAVSALRAEASTANLVSFKVQRVTLTCSSDKH